MEESDHELVVLSLPGVQRFIGEARSTADLRSGSEIVTDLARTAATAAARAAVDVGEQRVLRFLAGRQELRWTNSVLKVEEKFFTSAQS